MADLATLKSTIERQIHRSDLTTDIASAISSAIKHYQSKRFTFNQTRATFSTVAGTEFYSSLTDIAEIDAVTVTVNGRKVALSEWGFGEMEVVSTTTNTQGQPWAYSWYAEQIRLYPVPDAVYTITVSYLQKIAEPSTDGTSNEWTTEAEELIRHAAKKRLYRDVTLEPQMAMVAEQAEIEAYRRLMQESQKLTTGGLRANF